MQFKEVNSSTEVFDVVDEQGKPIGEYVSRTKAHTEGICHRTAQIWMVRIQDGKPQVLLQKRVATKESYPNCYDISAAGHIKAGDEPLESALRELEEELGIHAEEAELEYQGYHYIFREEVFNGRAFKDREVGFVYVYSKPVEIEKLTLQKDEVDSVCWFDIDTVVKKVETQEADCCVTPGGMKLAQLWFEKGRQNNE